MGVLFPLFKTVTQEPVFVSVAQVTVFCMGVLFPLFKTVTQEPVFVLVAQAASVFASLF